VGTSWHSHSCSDRTDSRQTGSDSAQSMSVSSGRYTLAVLSWGGTVQGAWELLGGSRGDVLALPQLFGSDGQSADRIG
jgi:hypothetical protein